MILPMDTASSQAGTEVFEQILGAPSGLVLLQSEDCPGLLEQFRSIARHTGQAVYLWQPDTGLGSMRDAHVRVPDCQRLGNALRFMQQSLHFGVYVLVGLELPLSAMDDTLLRQLARMPQGHLRRVVLVTQAWHMQRSRWSFEQAGFEVVPAPATSHRVTRIDRSGGAETVPSGLTRGVEDLIAEGTAP